jgi:hypothetical protein
MPTPVSRPPSLETRPPTAQGTHPSNTRQKSAEKRYVRQKMYTLIYPDPFAGKTLSGVYGGDCPVHSLAFHEIAILRDQKLH